MTIRIPSTISFFFSQYLTRWPPFLSRIFILKWLFESPKPFPIFFQSTPETGADGVACCPEGIVSFRSAIFCSAECCPGHSEVTEHLPNLGLQVTYCVREGDSSSGRSTIDVLKAKGFDKRRREFSNGSSLKYIVRMVK